MTVNNFSYACLPPTCMPSFMKCLFTSFTYYLIGFVFLLLSFESSLDILGTHHLSDKYFGYIFSQFITCLFILSALSFEYQRFIILITNLIVFCDSYFLCPIQKSLPNPKSQKFSSVFSYGSFIVLIYM